jgi:phage-related minor tail protein
MSQPVGDLTVLIDLDSTKFSEQVEYTRRQIRDMGKDTAAASQDSQQSFSRQEAAAQRAGISVGQYNAALRTLPAQFTDIATQLAGGQSPFLILLQQGGQVKDSFGGLAPMFQVFRDHCLVSAPKQRKPPVKHLKASGMFLSNLTTHRGSRKAGTCSRFFNAGYPGGWCTGRRRRAADVCMV